MHHRKLGRVTTVRFSDSEYARIRLAASDRGLSISELIRSVALGMDLPGPLPAALDSDAVSELRRIGVNLNQTTKMLTAWRTLSEDDKRTAWTRHRDTVVRLREHVDELARRLGVGR